MFCGFEFKIVATSVFFPLRRLRIKVSHANGNYSLQILEYSNPRPKFKTQILISKSVGAKLSRWHLRINSFWHQLRSLLELSRWHLRITSFWRQLGYSLGLEIPGHSFSGIPLFFRWHLEINYFWRSLGYLLELYLWHLGINSFCCQLKSSLVLGIPGYSFSGIHLWFPPLGFTMIICLWGTTHFPVGGLLCFLFLWGLHTSAHIARVFIRYWIFFLF